MYVYLQEDNGNGRPNHNNGGQVATLTRNGINYLGPVAGVNKYKVWKARCYPQPPHGGGCLQDPSSVHLDPNTTYWVYVWAGDDDTDARIHLALSTSETGAAGWSLGNSVLHKPEGSAHSNWGLGLMFPLKMELEGTTNPEVTVSINDVTVTEGTHATADFVVSLNRATSGPVTFDYETTAGTASDSSDFAASDRTVTIQPGETQATISIHIFRRSRWSFERDAHARRHVGRSTSENLQASGAGGASSYGRNATTASSEEKRRPSLPDLESRGALKAAARHDNFVRAGQEQDVRHGGARRRARNRAVGDRQTHTNREPRTGPRQAARGRIQRGSQRIAVQKKKDGHGDRNRLGKW